MTQYINHGVTLTSGQATKIKHARDKGTEVVIKLTKNNLTGNINLPLTMTQLNKIKKSKGGVELRLSKNQLKYMEKTGGFLGPFLRLLPALLGVLGDTEQSSGSPKGYTVNTTSEGSGIVSDAVAPIPVFGKILSDLLKKIGLGGNTDGLRGVVWGNGLYLEREGSGLFLDRRKTCEC